MNHWLAILFALVIANPALADPNGGGPGATPGPAGTSSWLLGCIYNASTPSPSNGQQLAVSCDANGKFVISGSISATNPSVGTTAAAVPASATYLAGNKSGNLVGLLLDANSYVDVNCQTGCSGGSFNNNADAVATSSTNGQAAAWLYAWNGATWDRLTDDGSKRLIVGASSGAFASGAIASGADVTEGTTADTCAGAGSNCTVDGRLQNLETLAAAALPACSASPCTTTIGNTGQMVSSSGADAKAVGCDTHVFKHITSATDTLAVQGVSAKTVKICGVKASFSGSAAQTIFIENTASTNANCSSANTQITGAVVGNATTPSSDGFYNALWGGLANTSANGVCINSTGTGGVDVDLFYTQGS